MDLQTNAELTTTELLERGWTRTLIKRFLPNPDGCVPVAHWANFRGQDTYFAIKVWNVEQSEEFGSAFLKNWHGRTGGRMKDTTPENVLDKMRETPRPKIEPRSEEEAKRDAAVAKAAEIFKEIRARGYRTPHKC